MAVHGNEKQIAIERELAIKQAQIVANLRKLQSPLFSTYISIDDIVKQMDIKGEMAVVTMMVVNTVIEQIVQGIENGTLSN
jgi:hypothetical protein